jgi:hypothetical protein
MTSVWEARIVLQIGDTDIVPYPETPDVLDFVVARLRQHEALSDPSLLEVEGSYEDYRNPTRFISTDVAAGSRAQAQDIVTSVFHAAMLDFATSRPLDWVGYVEIQAP